MKTIPSLLIVSLALFGAAVEEFSTSFEKLPPGTPYVRKAWEQDGFNSAGTQTMDINSAIDTAFAHSGRQSLRMNYPKGKVGPSECGGQAKLMLEPAEEYYASYYLRFSDDFSWGGRHEGGKLPGLATGHNCSGGQSCDGTNGFSARFMWRHDGEAVLYLYHMDKPHKWGENFKLKYPDGSQVIFPRGEWVQLVERVKVNSVSEGKANKDGEVQVWFNGQEVLNLKGIRFVSNEDKIDNFYFSTFHGGNTLEWAPENDSFIWFDDLLLSRRKEAVF